MDLFVWDRSFGTGLPEMDDQHRGLIDIFNELHRTLFDPNYPPDRREVSLRRAFDRLMAYARAQFAAQQRRQLLASLPEVGARPEVAAAVEMLTSMDGWLRLRRTQGLRANQSRLAIVAAVQRLLAD